MSELSRLLARALTSPPLRPVEALAEESGVPRGIVLRALACRPVSADAFLRLCAVVGLVPAWGAASTRDSGFGFTLSPTRPTRPCALSFAFAGMAMRLARTDRGHNIRDGAAAAGVSVTTTSRIEAGKVVSIESVVRVAAYVGVSVTQFVAEAPHGQPVSRAAA